MTIIKPVVMNFLKLRYALIFDSALVVDFDLSAYKLCQPLSEVTLKHACVSNKLPKCNMYDYTLYKHSNPQLLDNVCLDLDFGYLGIRDYFSKLYCMLSIKKKNLGRGKRGVKARALSMEQRALNKLVVKESVVVEHTNSRVKKLHIFEDEFRNRLKRYDIMSDIVCGLVNFRIAGTLVI
jgi:hypothetical protein